MYEPTHRISTMSLAENHEIKIKSPLYLTKEQFDFMMEWIDRLSLVYISPAVRMDQYINKYFFRTNK